MSDDLFGQEDAQGEEKPVKKTPRSKAKKIATTNSETASLNFDTEALQADSEAKPVVVRKTAKPKIKIQTLPSNEEETSTSESSTLETTISESATPGNSTPAPAETNPNPEGEGVTFPVAGQPVAPTQTLMRRRSAIRPTALGNAAVVAARAANGGAPIKSASPNSSNSQQRQSQRNGNKNKNNQGKNRFPVENEAEDAKLIDDGTKEKLYLDEIAKLPVIKLREKALQMGLDEEFVVSSRKQDLVFAVVKKHVQEGVVYSRGTLQVVNEGFGFLRSVFNSYLAGSNDIYISPTLIKTYNLKTGDDIFGQIRPPRDDDKYFGMLKITELNFEDPELGKSRIPFETLIPLFPDSRINLETANGELSTRMINLFSPIGKGQRGLIVAPPRTGKTVLLQKIANAITENHPEVYLIVLLIDERPEEVTDMRRNVKGEVIASTFDEQASNHCDVAEMVIEKAKSLVEYGKDVVILLDSITRLARAYNQTVPTSGKVLSGGVDSNALHKPKRFFGAARNIEGGGSLTIIASALIETGSRMDEVIFEEFKGTGNMELILDRRMSDRRLFPAVNVKRSGTRKEDLLLSQEEMAKIWLLRKVLNPMDDLESTELIIERLKKSKDNESFLKSMATTDMEYISSK